jgi:hypothetical protein
MHFADVMHSDVPFVAGAMEYVREASGGVVAFEHQHSPGGVLGQEGGGRKPADTGADDDGVKAVGGGRMLMVGIGC